MKYILMDYVKETGWPELSKSEQEHWLGAYRAYMEAMHRAGVLKDSKGLYPTSDATTVRVVNDKPQVIDGPFADTKEQLGGFHIIEVPDRASRLCRSQTGTRRHAVNKRLRRIDYFKIIVGAGSSDSSD